MGRLGRFCFVVALLIPLHCLSAAEPERDLVIFEPRQVEGPKGFHRFYFGLGKNARLSNRDRGTPATIREALRSPFVRIAVHQYPASWGSFAVVAEYIVRLLDSANRGGLNGLTWSEWVETEVFATIEFPAGVKRFLRVGTFSKSGYVCFEDVDGEIWCGRYVGVAPKNASNW